MNILARTRSRLIAVATVGAVASLGVTAGLASASAGTTAAKAGVIHVYEIGGVGPADHDVFTGAFTDHGVDHTGALDHGLVNKIVLTKGTFEANISTLFNQTKVVSENPTTCSLVIKGVAKVPLSNGTGAYKGIHGSLAVTFTDAMILKKKGGKCPTNAATAKDAAEVGIITGSGKVKF